MRVDKNTKQTLLKSIEIKRIMSEGGVLWEASTVPGPTKLIGGNLQAGFYGEVPASDFITGDELARRIGLTAGVSQYSDEPWLKFSYLDKTEFVAKKPFRHSITWNNINAVNAVFGNQTIKIGDNNYKIRLMKGNTEGKQNGLRDYKGTINHNSEWNRLMLPIHENAPSNWEYTENVNSPTENWNIGYTNNDLITSMKTRNGSCSWCVERSSIQALTRGWFGISGSNAMYFDTSSDFCGWRPVLELVD